MMSRAILDVYKRQEIIRAGIAVERADIEAMRAGAVGERKRYLGLVKPVFPEVGGSYAVKLIRGGNARCV